MVARRLFLLVAGLLLLVDDNQADIFDRSENRGTRADDDAGLAVANTPPFASAFYVRAISGTRMIAVLPLASVSCTARKYTSVLPLPVTP